MPFFSLELLDRSNFGFRSKKQNKKYIYILVYLLPFVKFTKEENLMINLPFLDFL